MPSAVASVVTIRRAQASRRGNRYDASMFRFVYASALDEPIASTLIANGFVGIEAGSPHDGVPWIGSRTVTADTSLAYTLVAPLTLPAVAAGRHLHALAEQRPKTLVLIESGGAFLSPHDLWLLMEAARHPRVKVALDLDVARASGQSASVLVPTLNLRIGLVRVRTLNEDITPYARRLAGIGFEGFVVVDPPAESDRPILALAMAERFRSVFPAKLAKIVPATPAVAGPRGR